MGNAPEIWLRGPLKNIPALLQPVAHALLQAREEVNSLMDGFPEELLEKKLGGLASPGFHLQHLTGVINRLFTYALDKPLNVQQLDALSNEGIVPEGGFNKIELLTLFSLEIDKALVQLSLTEEPALIAYRPVGRAKLPSTVIGLYMHAAEHTMRHIGQLLVTVTVLLDK